ncbi:Rv0361 family membrane protein [Mycobacterium botniense]|uniref:DUF8174 domain-containing protein n=1 Tax=Mycobacterium botniense TaxID=84962 RepID=A0A7I9Y0D6_9MYCO|nr:hypothetical protein [Mycobacterium botniense]GFG75528.1 hypothetical protein MBOT_28930 [Mycobacterium botniense]
MPAPHPRNRGVGAGGPPSTTPPPGQRAINQPGYPGTSAPGTPSPSGPYPGRPLPPPLPYPKHQRRRLIVGAVLTFALIAVMTVGIGYGTRATRSATGPALSDAMAKTAIQGYLDALEQRDLDTIARNTLCGIYDAVRDRRSDQALAKLSSDAFRKQFSKAEVTSIDKIVYWSQYQAQVLFTMRVTPATGGPARGGVQGLAQVLLQRNHVLVCSYVLRTAGTY